MTSELFFETAEPITPAMIQDGIERAHRERSAFVKRLFAAVWTRVSHFGAHHNGAATA